MDKNAAWAMFFASVVSFQHHPGVKNPLSLEQCAEMADCMLEKYLERASKWLG